MKRLLIAIVTLLGITSCGDNNRTDEQPLPSGNTSSSTTSSSPSYDPQRGEGKFTNVEISPTLEKEKANAGEKIFEVKCSSCHKLGDEKLVGPGWKGVTNRHTPEWVMNFITNPDVMLDKDPKAQAMLELCLVRMPNQNLSDEEARNIYEFMRKNDGVQ